MGAATTPAGPCGPVAPVSPAGPCGPIAPVAPTGPCGPGAPAGPAGPMGPTAPAGPIGPCGPVAPVAPFAPAGPVAPCGPATPAGPAGPCGPMGPGCPGASVNAGDPFTETVTVLLLPQMVALPAALVVPPLHAPETSKSMRNCPAVPITLTGETSVLCACAVMNENEMIAAARRGVRRRMCPQFEKQ